MVEMSQVNLSANARRTFMSTVFISEIKLGNITNCRWAPFPFELTGASLVVPSPSGERLLVVRNNDGKSESSQAKLEIWGQGQLLKEMHVPASVHGPVYSDEWYIILYQILFLLRMNEYFDRTLKNFWTLCQLNLIHSKSCTISDSCFVCV